MNDNQVNQTNRYLKIIDNVLTDSDYPVMKVTIENGIIVSVDLTKHGLYVFPNMMNWTDDQLNRWLAYDGINDRAGIEHIEIDESEIR